MNMVPMIISCPNCSTTYNVNNATLGPQGKSVRCSNCEQQWHQLPVRVAPVQQTLAYAPQPEKQLEGMIDPTMLQAQIRAQMQAIMATSQMQQPAQMQSAAQPAPEPEPITETEPIPESKPMPEPAPDPEEETPSQQDLDDMFGDDEPKPPVSLMDDDDADVDDGFNSLDDIQEPDPIPESLMSQDAYDEDEDEDEDKSESGNSVILILGVVFLMLIIGTAVGGFFLRDMVQEMVPQTKPLYEMIGLSDPLGTGLDIQDVRSQREQQDGNDILAVKGNIVNISEKLRMVPLIRISLFNAEDEEVQFINLTPDMAEIPAGETMNFKGSIINPATKAKKMEVTFTEPKATEETKK